MSNGIALTRTPPFSASSWSTLLIGPPFYTQVASDVQTSAGEQEVTVPCDVNTSWGFQL